MRFLKSALMVSIAPAGIERIATLNKTPLDIVSIAPAGIERQVEEREVVKEGQSQSHLLVLKEV